MKIFFLIFFSFFGLLFGSDAKFEQGKMIYFDTCVSCHGENGESNKNLKLIVMPRDLKKSILTEKQTYNIIKKVARYWGAAADIMPSFESVYSDEEIKAVAYYISKAYNPNVKEKIKKLLDKEEPIPEKKIKKMAKRGKKIYFRNCSWCHGLEAKGDGEATKNPEMSIFPYDLTKTILTQDQMFLYVKYGGKFWGTHKDDMPSWSRKYDDFTLRSVVKYVDEHFKREAK
jgi:mono/diheme cytochrome c family protein